MLRTIHESIGSPLAFGLAGHWEIVIIDVVVLLLFGGKKLPELARGVARGLHIFKSEMKGIKTDVEDSISDKDADKTPAPPAAAEDNKSAEESANPNSGNKDG